ncbi:hypothetical protein WICMUC_001384 [Wickerhamomyces mucosus]|uniref:Serine/threonine-protein kinase RAD53 n=1 Tax=Wickerhamomyces mucosus TaxID=1378264 RepID=A0A9P8PUG1_9ASCO|nr:hypothetical protein WICMUC_001384 [Wickerhamomyces mucosus]
MDLPTQPTQQATQQAGQLDDLTQEDISDSTIFRLICTTGQLSNIDFKEKPLSKRPKEWLFGRNSNCDISYNGTSRLSNRHFKIWCGSDSEGGKHNNSNVNNNNNNNYNYNNTNNNNVLIQDLSTNGTWVNNQRIVKGQNYILSQGDEIAVGIGVPKDILRFIVFFPKPKVNNKDDLKDQVGIHKEFSIKDEVVGQGAFAIVKKAVERNTGKTYAVKIISKRKIMGNTDGVNRELEILRKLDHPGIVKLRGFYEDDDFYYLVMEFVPGGDLMDFVAAHGSVGEEAGKEITKQILQAIQYVHSLGISHRDLKPDNILIAQDDPVKVKITDFGLAKISNTGTFMKTFCGTLAYVAPEVIDNRFSNIINMDKYSSLVDMWSLGCLVYVILTAHLPFSGNSQEQLYKQIKQGSYHERPLKEAGVSKEAIDFLNIILQVDPRERASAGQALQHPWITSTESQLNSQISLSQSQSQQQRLESQQKLKANDGLIIDEVDEVDAIDKADQDHEIGNEPKIEDIEAVFKIPQNPIPTKPSNNISTNPQSQASQQKTKKVEDPDHTSLIEDSNESSERLKDITKIPPRRYTCPPGTSLILFPGKSNLSVVSRVFILQGISPFFIGRNEVCHKAIKDDRLSKIHCAIFKKRHPVGNGINESPAQGLEDIWLLDFSTNGCYINGSKIGKNKKSLIFNNDEIMLFRDNTKKEFLKFRVIINDGTGLFNNGENRNKDEKIREIIALEDSDHLLKPKLVIPPNYTPRQNQNQQFQNIFNRDFAHSKLNENNKRVAVKDLSSQKPIKRANLGKGDRNSSFQTLLK